MKTILAFGDSNTWGHDHAHCTPEGCAQRMGFEERWPGRLQLLLGPDYRVIENGLCARTCVRDDPYFPKRQGLDSLLVALEVNAPLDLVVLHIGVNELKAMFGLSAGMIAAGAEKLAQAAKTACYGYPAPKVLLVAPPPTAHNVGELLYGDSFGPDAYAKSLLLGAAYEAVARRNACGFLDAGTLGFSLNPLDGLHYCRDDHAKLAAAVADKAREMLT